MGFIAKSPLEMAELDSTPTKYLNGTRALFATAEGWKDVDENGEVRNIAYEEGLNKHAGSGEVHIVEKVIEYGSESELDELDSGVYKITHYTSQIGYPAKYYLIATRGADRFNTLKKLKQTKISNSGIETRMWDPEITDSEGIITGGWADWIPVSGDMTVDAELDSESTNAIQNKAVAKAISNIPVVVVTIALNSPTFTESDELNKLTDKKLYRLQHDSSEICGWLFCSKRDGAVGNECEQLLIDRDNNIYRRKSTYINEDEYGWTEWERFATLGDVTDNIKSEINKIIDGSPEALDTLYELAKALGNDENFSATVMAEIGKKADKASLEEAESDIARILDGRASVGKAIRDSKGNYIHTYYATKEEIYNKLNSQKYYGDMNIVPTDSSLFDCYFDEDELTVEIYGFLKEENIEELVIPYEIKKDGLSYRVNIVTISPAFENNIFLKTVIFPSSLDVIGDTAFKGCTNLEKVVFSKGNTQIWAETFCNCTKLKSITLPDTIISIQEKAFDGSGLTDVYYEGTKEQWDLISISEDNETLLNASIHFNWNIDSQTIGTIDISELESAPVGIYKLDYGYGEAFGYAVVCTEGIFKINPDGTVERPLARKIFAEYDLGTGFLDDFIVAQKAIADKNGNIIDETYATKEELSDVSGENITVDSELDSESTNPVQNKVITQMINRFVDDISMLGLLKVNNIAEYSNDENYPTTGAVDRFVAGKIGDIETSLDGIITEYGLDIDTINLLDEIIDSQNEFLEVDE